MSGLDVHEVEGLDSMPAIFKHCGLMEQESEMMSSPISTSIQAACGISRNVPWRLFSKLTRKNWLQALEKWMIPIPEAHPTDDITHTRPTPVLLAAAELLYEVLVTKSGGVPDPVAAAVPTDHTPAAASGTPMAVPADWPEAIRLQMEASAKVMDRLTEAAQAIASNQKLIVKLERVVDQAMHQEVQLIEGGH